MSNSYITKFVGKRVVLYLSLFDRLINHGVVGVLLNSMDGWIEVKSKSKVEYISIDKIYSFRLLD